MQNSHSIPTIYNVVSKGNRDYEILFHSFRVAMGFLGVSPPVIIHINLTHLLKKSSPFINNNFLAFLRKKLLTIKINL